MKKLAFVMSLAALFAAPAIAQDSVAAVGDTDAVIPWDVSEQQNSYVLDLVPTIGSWGTQFGSGVLAKSGNNPADIFENTLISAQAISRLQLEAEVSNPRPYAVWNNAPGVGINPNANLDPDQVIEIEGLFRQFAAGFSEFGGPDDPTLNHGGIIGTVVRYDPADRSRLYVDRWTAAINTEAGTDPRSGFGFGTVDEYGTLLFRADQFDVAGFSPLPALLDDSIFRVRMEQTPNGDAGRDPSVINTISNTFFGGGAGYDLPATDALLINQATTHSPGTIVPGSVDGFPQTYLGPNFNTQFVRGKNFGGLTADSSHLQGGDDHRGGIGYTSRNFFAGATNGTAGIISGPSDVTRRFLSIWGLDNASNVAGFARLALPNAPGGIPDSTTGTTLGTGAQVFNHYRSQTAFRGGTSQVAVGVDRTGNLLAAAEVDIAGAANTSGITTIAAARLAPGQPANTAEWTAVAYTLDFPTLLVNGGKPILDGAGVQIGELRPLNNFFDGTGRPNNTQGGPSISAPTIDSVGNIWFISSCVLYGPNGQFDGGPFTIIDDSYHLALFRAIYDEVDFGYRLELVVKTDDIFLGRNSGIEYKIDSMQIADSNSVSSGTLWSHNASEVAFDGKDPLADWETRDARTNGGVVVNLSVLYDVNQNGEFEFPVEGGGPVEDQEYNVLYYIGSVDEEDTRVCLCGDSSNDGAINTGDIDFFVQAVLNGEAGWQALFGGNAPCPYLLSNDINGDGVVNTGDIDPFVNLLLNNGPCGA